MAIRVAARTLATRGEAALAEAVAAALAVPPQPVEQQLPGSDPGQPARAAAGGASSQRAAVAVAPWPGARSSSRTQPWAPAAAWAALQDQLDLQAGACQYAQLPGGEPGAPGEDSGSAPTPPPSSSGSSSEDAAGVGGGEQHDTLAQALMALQQQGKAARLTPKAIVAQLDKHIVGQAAAKRAVAVSLRNRWRRHRLPKAIADEITPKNILMVGPTGCGKTEIARRLAKLVDAPFIKVEATKFTELGFVGRDVDEIVKDLVEAAITLTRTRLAEGLRGAAAAVVEELLLRELVGPQADPATRDVFRPLYRSGELDERVIDIDIDQAGSAAAVAAGSAPIPGFVSGPGAAGSASFHQALSQMMDFLSRQGVVRPGERGGGSSSGSGERRRQGKSRMTIAEARKLLLEAEVDRSLSSDRVVKEALRAAQEDGIVFIDEIDKVVETNKGLGGATSSNVSSEGVQRDLLPILEGSLVQTKYGNVATDHVLFIASGAFHSSKPGDMLAELQGRLPVRVELSGLTADDFYRILTEPQHNMLRQQKVLMATEGVDLHFTDGAVRAIAQAAEQANKLLDNIGARRLHTVIERVLADISFTAPDRVAAARRQAAEQQAAGAAAAAEAEARAGPAGSGAAKVKGGKGGKAGSKAVASKGSSSSSSSSQGSGPHSPAAAAPGSRSSSSSGTEPQQLLVRFEVDEALVDACMAEVLKQKDLSRYVL